MIPDVTSNVRTSGRSADRVECLGGHGRPHALAHGSPGLVSACIAFEALSFTLCRILYGLADAHSAEKQFRNQRLCPHPRTSAGHISGTFASMQEDRQKLQSHLTVAMPVFL